MSKLVTLNDLGCVNRGRPKHRPRNAPEFYGGPYTFVHTADIQHVNLYITEYEQTYSETGLAQSTLRPVGTLRITIAANIADTAIWGSEACPPDSVMGFISDEDKCDVRCVKYLFDTELQEPFQQLSQCVVQNNLSKDKLLLVKFCIPDLPIQRRMAGILFAYDGLIENNRRRTAILEEATRRIFEAEIVNGNWECEPVNALVEVNPEVPKPACDGIRNIPMSALSTSGMTVDRSGSEIRAQSTYIRFSNGDVLLAGITPCLENGKTAYVIILADGEIGCGSSEFIVLGGKRVSPYFTYCLTRLDAFRGIVIKSMIGASVRQRVQLSCFLDFQIQVPDDATLRHFDATVAPMLDQIGILSKQSAALADACDMLLPRLMKGMESFANKER